MVIEIAPTYSLAADDTVELFSEYLGKRTKIIFIIRNPVDRWLSQDRFDLKVAIQKDLDDETLPFAAELLSAAWKRDGGYREYIETWEKYFPNTSFVFHEDLHAPDAKGLKQICETLSIPWLPDVFEAREGRVNSQGGEDFPAALRTWVASERADELNWMAGRFGERAVAWRDQAHSLLDK